ncbi:ATP-binding protein [Geobacter pelophilus]|uniref:ATP-binding protein n=1 Tax=Geoanaerobacter pelophilus TaxID=60036 RepID=A0AAW4L744_9BACT|nr:AAA family ATPase [Geoanaerobacter pelophilus]MBT0665987.1 ATP-binding protein [Geoanaerobacter pelophilus]
MACHSSLKKPAGLAREKISYRQAYEHAIDELNRLDLLIRRQLVLRKFRGESDQLSQFKGLVISDDEVSRILSCPVHSGDPEIDDRAGNEELQALARELDEQEQRVAARVATAAGHGSELPLCRIAAEFGLSPFEVGALVICLAPEVDSRYQRLYGYLHDDITRQLPTPGLILNLLSASPDEKLAGRKAFSADSPLFRHRLLSHVASPDDAGHSSLSRPLRIDGRIAAFLLGGEGLDERISGFAKLCRDDHNLDLITLVQAEQKRLHKYVWRHSRRKQGNGRGLVLYFHGPEGTGRSAMAKGICHDLGIPLLAVDIARMPSSESAFQEAVAAILREALLQSAGLCLDNFDLLLTDDADRRRLSCLVEALGNVSQPAFILGNSPLKVVGMFRGAHFLSVEFPTPDLGQRKDFWSREGAKGLRVAAGVDYGALAGRFRFTPGQIRHAVTAAADLAGWQHPESPQITEDDLYTACRRHSNPKLSELACKIVPKYGWDDLVLPPDRISQLEELCRHSKYRHVVYGEWGFDRKLSYGKGLSALFTGPPGTGKTMAAEVIANDLQLDLYKIDLSQVVSKYIGETEKNLDRIFTEATTGNAILFFDEADALFGKRSEVKDAHDRYANIETGYLLQKMEEYEGIAILATNLRGNMDEAFVRRIQFIVEFPFPQEQERLAIWQKIWPEDVPRGELLDLELIARRFEIAGGNIRNIAISAAFLAAGEGGGVAMTHLMQATRREYQKIGKIVGDGDFDRHDG